MPKHMRKQTGSTLAPDISLFATQEILETPEQRSVLGWVQSHWVPLASVAFLLLIAIGAMAKQGWLPHTDGLSGKRTGWFGHELTKDAQSTWNPFAAPLPSPSFLRTEYVYAGSRLVAAEDANASAIPPADLAVWRPSTGMWCVLGGSGQTFYQFGVSSDKPVLGDFDGDGKTDFAVFRPSGLPPSWLIVKSSDNTSYGMAFGLSTDTLVPADYDGDGKTDIAVWRSSDQNWYILPSSTCTPNCVMSSVHYGSNGDIPTPADYDGDGRADLSVWRPSTHSFYSTNTSNGAAVAVSFGTQSGSPVCGDYDGDGKANYGIWAEGAWIIMNATLTQTTTTQWGSDTDYRVQNDYDGDGKVDMAVWRPSLKSATWLILQSHDSSTRTEYWGVNGDIPVPALYRR